MLVVTRHVVAADEGPEFLDRARAALEALGAAPGYRDGEVGRATDDPTLWVVATRWRDVGAYRRALSSYAVKMHAVPLLSTALDEPSAFEVLAGAGERTGRAADAGTVAVGEASAPVVRTDLDG